MATEEERAEAYRLTLKNRKRYRRLLNRQLAGDESLRRTLEDNWKPLRNDQSAYRR